MGKKLILPVSILFICLILTRIGTANAQTTIFAIDPLSQTIPEPGITFDVNITVTDAITITQWALNVTWNPDILDFVEITERDFLSQNGSTMFLAKPAETGRIPEVTCLLMVDKLVSGDGVLCTITFNATAEGESNINIDWGVTIDYYTGVETEAEIINGAATVVPEFPASMLLPIFLIATIIVLLATTRLRKRLSCTIVP